MDNRELFDVHGNSDALARARMQIDNHNYEVYTNNDLIAIHKPRSTFSPDYYFSLLWLRSDGGQLHEIVDNNSQNREREIIFFLPPLLFSPLYLENFILPLDQSKFIFLTDLEIENV